MKMNGYVYASLGCFCLLATSSLWGAEKSNPVSVVVSTPADESAKPQEAKLAKEAAATNDGKISLEYKDVDLSSVLKSLSMAHKLNIITSPDVKGRVTINLQDVSVEDALNAILKINGLIYSKKDGMIFVSKGDASPLSVSTEVVRLKYLAASAAQNLIKSSLSSKGDVKINEVSNTLIISDFPENLEKVKELVIKVDTAPKQILIEAKIIDITSNDLRQIGINWSSTYDPVRGGLFKRHTDINEVLSTAFDLKNRDTFPLTGGQLGLTTLTMRDVSITGAIDALIRDGKATLLASPSIAVLNGQEARIVIGERFPYKERTQTTSGTTETTRFVDIGTTLRVNPQINDDGYITIALHPEVSSLLASLDAGPRITTREADTTVRIKEGETVVIGGLIKQVDNQTKDRFPFAGKIPLLGYLFRQGSVNAEQTELAVFITPKILLSREEMERNGKRDSLQDSYMLLQKTGKLSVVQSIFDKAVGLDRGRGLYSARKDEPFRKAQALSHFELIYLEFPDTVQAPEAMLRAARMHEKYYKNDKKAKDLYALLVSTYPRSTAADEARESYRRLESKANKTK